MRESELRQLRRRNTEYEEQNAILGKHIDNMKGAIGKLEVAAVQQRTNNLSLQQHLHALRATLTSNFSAIPLPGTQSPHLKLISQVHTALASNLSAR